MFSPFLPPSSNNRCRTLIIDDNVDYCELVADYLSDYGFTVSGAHTGISGIEELKSPSSEEPYTLVLLDFFLPDLNGTEVLKKIRISSTLPVIMLSAHNDETDRIIALEMGADDYIPKNFSSREMLARIRAVLRRLASVDAQPPSLVEKVSVSGITIDYSAHEARIGGKVLDITDTEFELLALLVQTPGYVFSRDELASKAGIQYIDKFDRSIDVHIASIRKKLGDDSLHPRFISTIRGVGYKFIS